MSYGLQFQMYRISNELSKPEYIPLLQQLSDGNLTGNNVKLMKSLVTGPETRRYIKPHRCNHQSKLARVYGGPKWLICTGYLNLNKPSLYDWIKLSNCYQPLSLLVKWITYSFTDSVNFQFRYQVFHLGYPGFPMGYQEFPIGSSRVTHRVSTQNFELILGQKGTLA